jgi:imidazolonepropionase-like amidohydrolase
MRDGQQVIRKAGRRISIALLVLVALLLVALWWPTARAPVAGGVEDYVLRDVRIVDVERGTAGQPTDVRVRNGVIHSIGAAAPGDVPVIEGGNRFLIPGLWDMHVHTFQLSPQMHLPLFLANGVTSVRDMMDCPQERDTLIACIADKKRWNAEVESGRMASPRIVRVASYYLDNPTLTPAEVRLRAAAAARRGINELKVYNRLSRPAYEEASRQARSSGLDLVGHLPKAVSLEEALAAGQRSFEHAYLFPRHCFARAADWRAGRLDSEEPTAVLEAMVREHDPAACGKAFVGIKQAGAWLVPTHVTREEDARVNDARYVNDARLDYLDPLSRWAFKDDLAGTRSAYPGTRGQRALRGFFREGLRLTGAAHRAGVPVLVGTDTTIGGFRYHDELKLLTDAGLSPADVLRAATIQAARYTGLDRGSGSIAVGKRADMVLLDADPLRDIRNTRRIRSVVLGGRYYDRAALDRLLGFTRTQAARPDMMVKLLWGFARSSVASDL